MPERSAGQELLASVFASIHAGMYATDTSGRLLLINPAALALLGRVGEDVLGISVHELAHARTGEVESPPAQSCALLSVLTTGTPARSDDDTFWRGDGTPLRVSWMSAPVVEEGRVTGAVCVFSDATTRHVETERLLAQHQAAVEAQERLAETADRLALLGRLSEALSTLDTDEALRRLARLTVGRLADHCLVHDIDADAVGLVAVAHHEPLAEQAEVPASSGRPATPLVPLTPKAAGPLARVLQTGVQHAFTCRPDESGPASDDPLDVQHARELGELGCVHALVTPLAVRRHVLGAMTWVRTDPQRPFTDADESFAAEVGRRAGVSLENARLYRQQRDAAESLQRSLLTVLPEPDHLHLTARYLPATHGVEVGGDWYDAFVLSDGATSLVIGDILGHDMTAAGHMGQVRNLLRGIAADRLAPPGEIVRRLDEAMDMLDVAALATCLLARIEQPEELRQAGLRQLRWSSAGHLPPAHVTASGHVQLLDRPGDLMLGVAPTLPRTDHMITIDPGDTVWLYTDGLVERRDQPLDQGLARLRRTLAALAGLPLDEACDELLARMLPDGHPDDVAVLAVRAHPEDRPRPAEAGPGHG